MMKRTVTIAIVLAFWGSSLLMMTSCAKKQTVAEQPAKPPAPVVTEVKEPAPSAESTAKEDQAALERRKQEEAARKLQMEIEAFESSKIYFDFDKSELKPEARAILDKKAAWLREHPEFNLRIEGHCDERGTNEYNLALGERRANAAFNYLNALGVSSSRMSTVSYGEERPVDPRHNEEAWAKNRRDEFRLIKK
ncbi:MAG: peptidoglycan-associated lipoprotein Pal [Deltaproteobacteria bacterium]|nr:peptidoglycan-associated lipoprotein Pal [Deltaproteobacteria bacterium]MBW2017159.1 peptidoglycan-associated lipoprotein Pal [Deltaproteobacteria bacterium]MBW2129885.1 peptidoglycan-associated lipoprotein Pal [Deltaproteobacteria bacterium]MBW2304977.1 peptidoglycan-associated lipoprotein Pal [Deltaproteobacteria bacterium]